MLPRFRRGRRQRPPDTERGLPTTRHRDGQPEKNPEPPQPQVPSPDRSPDSCGCRCDDRQPDRRPPVVSQVAAVLAGAGALLSGVAAVVPPDVLAKVWQVLLS